MYTTARFMHLMCTPKTLLLMLLVLQAQRVWSSVVNTATSLVKQYTTNTTSTADETSMVLGDVDTTTGDIHTDSVMNESCVHNTS